MFSALSAMFENIFDTTFAPADVMTATEISTDSPVCDWTNDFGTACDFEVPASSCDTNDMFSSDW